MKNLTFFLITIFVAANAFSQIANDDCTSAENIDVTTSATTVNFDITKATIINEEGCIGTTNDYADIWYEFTMPVNGNLFVDGNIGWNLFALYDVCNGKQIQCGPTSQLFESLNSGNTYKLRIFRTQNLAKDTRFNSFTIQAFTAATNDICTNAETITVSTSQTTIDFNIAGATINNQEGCAGTTDDFADIWYEFIMPVNGNVFVDGDINWNNFALYDACDSSQLQCGSQNQLFENLTPGNSYKLRAFRDLSLATYTQFTSFTIEVFEAATNDVCASAETITVGTAQSTVNFNIAGATTNNEEGCTGTTNDYADVWFEFIMPFNGNVFIDGNISWNQFALYEACTGNQIQCGALNEVFGNLSAGLTYKLRVFRELSLASNMSFALFTIQAFPPVVNDTCNNAENLTIDTSPQTVNFNIIGASINNEEGCTGIMDNYADIWYTFTMPVNGNLLVETHAWNRMALYDSCSGNLIKCGFADQVFENLSSGNNYKLRVFRSQQLVNDTRYNSFKIQAFEAAANDICDNAENLTVDTSLMTVDFNIAGASINNEVGCTGTTDDYADVWFEFTMPISGSLQVDGDTNLNKFALYDVCNGNQIECGINDPLFENLLSGNSYKLRAFRDRSLITDPRNTNFTIQAISTLGTTETNFENQVSIYPNPASNEVTVKSKTLYTIDRIEFFDLTGKKIKQVNLKQNSFTINDLQSGLYILKMYSDQKNLVKKLMVK
ncbi:T9SS type A sorting domain-containing protein [Algibacter sp. 2305UL17-15]|uniref:T9SS type A sorting domain-containing protein n=1 Tax=Algibacter sp. 2305UL17-15 TaxID=3231268 RepID=UPI0034586539